MSWVTDAVPGMSCLGVLVESRSEPAPENPVAGCWKAGLWAVLRTGSHSRFGPGLCGVWAARKPFWWGEGARAAASASRSPDGRCARAEAPVARGGRVFTRWANVIVNFGCHP